MLITLPLPPTDNELHIASRSSGRLINSPKYRAWKAEVKQLLFDANVRLNTEPTQVTQHEYWLAITMCNYRSDFTNYIKAIKDVLQGFLYKNDQWVNLFIQMPVEVDPTIKFGVFQIDTIPRIYTTMGVGATNAQNP